MSRMKVCVVTGSRAEYGQLLPLLRKLEEDPYFEMSLVVTGSHLVQSMGYTVSEIEKSGIPIAQCIPVKGIEDNSRVGVGNQISCIIADFCQYFNQHRPDALIVIGDRYEMFAVGIAASTLLIPICHICGGSVTSGAIDEVYRHSLTKMSCAHFTTCDVYRNRVIQLGEHPDTVFNVGSLAIENCLRTELLNKDELSESVGVDFNNPYCVVTFHPVTLEQDDSEDQVMELVKAFEANSQYHYLITLSNADAGGEKINSIWKREAEKHENFHVVASLGMKRYLSALKYAEMMIGNSSSGTTEGPSMKIPVIDIGDRQKGRVFSECLIHCEPNTSDIVRSIQRASSDEFKQIAHNVRNPFGDGTTSDQIVSVLKDINDKLSVKKIFYDVKFEVES